MQLDDFGLCGDPWLVDVGLSLHSQCSLSSNQTSGLKLRCIVYIFIFLINFFLWLPVLLVFLVILKVSEVPKTLSVNFFYHSMPFCGAKL